MIEDCIRSIQFCDEILLIDSFSTDRTVEIAQSLGARVIQREWPGFKERKGFGLKSVEHEWVISLDADERVSPELKESIIRVLEEDAAKGGIDEGMDQINGYMINRVVYYLGRWWNKGGWYPEYRLRFFRRSKTEWGGVDPHEKPIVSGKISKISGDIYHYTYRDIDDQFLRLHRYSTVSAKESFRKGKKPSLFAVFFNPILRATKFLIFKKGYREGVPGLIVAIIEAYYTFMKYAKLWAYHYQAEHEKNDTKNT